MKAKIDRISEFYKLSVDMDLFSRKTELIWWDELDYKGFNELDIHNCYSLKDKWPPDMCCFVTGEKPVDFTYFGPHLKIVSDQARKTIKKYTADDTEFLPVKVIQKETGREFGPYWVLNILRTIDALDEEQTFWNGGSPPSQDEPHVITKIIKPAIIKEKVSDANLFCLRVRGKVDGAIHYISHSLVEHLEKENVVLGLYLRYVKVV